MTTTSKTRRPLQVSKPAASSAVRDFRRKQAAQIFEEIADLACMADRVGFWAGTEESIEQHEDALRTIRALLKQIGLLADVGADKLDAGTVKGVEAENWLMPPVYPRDYEFQEPPL